MDLNNLDEASLQRLVQQLIATGQFKPKEPTEPEAWNIEGLEAYEKGEFDYAIECFEKAIELDPNFVEPYDNLNAGYLTVKEFDKALDLTLKAVQKWPNNIVIRATVAYIYEWKGMDQEAKVAYEEALKLDPTDEDYKRALKNVENRISSNEKKKKEDESIPDIDSFDFA
eukprot:TRINITY_DN13586_c0_g1_i1.p1 TRINITY_DN13586_c0_g1~~TRINITY_DN13586_c0_g1_i1.p1  ORF type:complete len:170 (-),score=37.57 TRINITY_DN13586_c0_g1_i1:60-569(-)